MNTLHEDVLLLVIKQARCCDYNDLITLRALSTSCKALADVMWRHREDITRYYAIEGEAFNGSRGYHIGGALHCLDDVPFTTLGGNKYWYHYGLLHRDGDLPAIEEINQGQTAWYQYGRLHRDDDKPALIYGDGSQYWYRHGKLHRDNGKPAMIWADGTQKWYVNGLLHRASSDRDGEDGDDDGYAAIYPCSKREWYYRGKLHREQGPAVIHGKGRREWYWHGELHRDNGPAIEDGTVTQWYKHGKRHRYGGPAVVYKITGVEHRYHHGQYISVVHGTDIY